MHCSLLPWLYITISQTNAVCHGAMAPAHCGFFQENSSINFSKEMNSNFQLAPIEYLAWKVLFIKQSVQRFLCNVWNEIRAKPQKMGFQIFCQATWEGNSSGFAIGSQLGLIFLATSCNFSWMPWMPSLRPARMCDLNLWTQQKSTPWIIVGLWMIYGPQQFFLLPVFKCYAIW